MRPPLLAYLVPLLCVLAPAPGAVCPLGLTDCEQKSTRVSCIPRDVEEGKRGGELG